MNESHGLGAAPGTAGKRRVILGLKIFISVGLIVLLLTKIDLQLMLTQARRLDGLVILLVLAILLVQTCILVGLRLQLALSAIGTRLSFWSATQISLSGLFVEQVAFGMVGGDAARLWLLNRNQVSFARSLTGLLLDRIIGLGSLLLLTLIGLDTIIVLFGGLDLRISMIVVAIVAVLLAATLVFLFVHRQRVSAEAAVFLKGLRASSSPGRFLSCLAAVFLFAVVIHLLNVLIMWLLAKNLGLPLSLAQCLLIIPTVLLVSMLPIASGGWGIREGMMVVVLGQLGIPAEQAVVPSLVFGSITLIATLPGSIVWVFARADAVKSADAASNPSGNGSRLTSEEAHYERIGRAV